MIKPTLRIVGGESGQMENTKPTVPKQTKASVLFVTVHPAFLSELGIAYHHCDNAEKALILVGQQTYSSVFIDSAELSDRVTGSQLIRSLRRIGVTAPIFLMSQNPSVVDRDHAIRRGASALVRRTSHDVSSALGGNAPVIDSTSAPVVSRANVGNHGNPENRRAITTLLADYTGPAAAVQARRVLADRGPAVSDLDFADALSAFVEESSDRQRFLLAVKRVIK